MKIVDLRSFFISESNEMKKYINEGLKDAKQLFVPKLIYLRKKGLNELSW